jgi:hypothetical protein
MTKKLQHIGQIRHRFVTTQRMEDLAGNIYVTSGIMRGIGGPPLPPGRLCGEK